MSETSETVDRPSPRATTDRPLRILFLSHYYPPEVNAPATRTHAHARRWVESGHEVTVVTSNPNCPGGVVYEGYRNRLRRQRETIDGVEVIRIWTFLAPNAGTGRRIANYVSFMLSSVWTGLTLARPDVVVATSPQFFNGWAGVLLKWLRRRPLVLEIRDIWPESIQAVGAMQGGLAIRVLERLERRMYRAADRIVAVGEGYKRNILSKVTPREDIAVVTNGVDPEEFNPATSDAAFRAEVGLPAEAFVCSYVGTIGMAHGLEIALEAAALLRDEGRSEIRFLLVGDGAERGRLEMAARERGLDEQVVFTGRLPKEAMPRVLAASDCCLVHLRGCELFSTVIPSKIFETMAMGRPIIMAVKGQAADIVAAADAGLTMTPDDADDLVRCVTSLADDEPLRRRLSEQGPAYVREHFSRDRLATDMLAVLDDLVD